MSGNVQGSASSSDVCAVYCAADLPAVLGVNAGEGFSGAADAALGDVYRLEPEAEPLALAVNADDPANTEDGVIGCLGQDFTLDSRLTFVGSDGSRTEVLAVRAADGHGDDGTTLYALPVSPLKPGIEYTLVTADEDPGDFDFGKYGCVCFSRGTMLRMADGTQKPIEAIAEGDLVLTRDRGAQPVRWIGGRTVPAFGHLAPIVISQGALRNSADLIVSPQHRMLIADWRAEVMLGSHEVLVKACDLVNGDTIYRREGGVVDYYHILFDTHEIVYSEGIPSESLQVNRATLDSLSAESRAEIVELFPEIDREPQVSAVASRMSLKSYEATALLRQVGFQ